MAKHNRIEFSDFGDSDKKTREFDDFLGDDSLDGDLSPESDIIIKGEEPRYRRSSAKAGLFAEDVSEEFSYDADGFDYYGDDGYYGGADDYTAAQGGIAEDISEKNYEEPAEGPVSANFDDDEDDMFNPKNKKNKGSDKKAVVIASVAAGIVVLIIAVLVIIVCTVANKKTIYSGICLYGKDLGGMTQSEASEFISKTYVDPINNADITIELSGQEYVYPMTDFVQCPNPDDIARQAYELHRDESLFKRFFSILNLKKNNYQLELVYNITDEKLDSIMSSAENVSFSDPVDPSYVIKENMVTFASGSKGTSIDKMQFEQDLYGALSAFEQEMQTLGTGESLNDVKIVAKVTDVDFRHLDANKIYSETYVAAKNPYFYLTTDSSGKKAVGVASQEPGRALIKEDLLDVVGRINSGEDIAYAEVRYETVWANMSSDELWAMLFRDGLAYTTSVNGYDENDADGLTDQEARGNNFSIIASKLSGTILMPGESFNFNDLLGRVNSSRGYEYAKEYSYNSGRLLGGGVSQAASAIYVAALKSGFAIAEHTNNEYLPYYGIKGFDAYVNSSSGANLVFTNDTAYPVKVNVYYDGSSLSVSIYGTDDGGFRSYSLNADLQSSEESDGYTEYKYSVSRQCDSINESLGEVVYKGEASQGTLPTDEPDNSDIPATETPTDNTSETPTVSPTDDSPDETPTETVSPTPTPTPSNTDQETASPTATGGPNSTDAAIE